MPDAMIPPLAERLRSDADHLRTLRECSDGIVALATDEALRIETLLREAAAALSQQEAAFKAGYHCRWHKGFGKYCFDPAMSPGDPDGAYAAWLKALGLTAPPLGALRPSGGD